MAAKEEAFTDRRRSRRRRQSPEELLADVPAVVALARLPVPLLAVADAGVALFCNNAFALMVGRDLDTIYETELADILPWIGDGDAGAVAAMQARADQIVELIHADESAVRALMTQSVMLRHDDPVAMSAFVDIGEQIWQCGGRGVTEASWHDGQIVVRRPPKVPRMKTTPQGDRGQDTGGDRGTLR
jgi:hypothetical protein